MAKLSELVKLREHIVATQNYESLKDEFEYLEHETYTVEDDFKFIFHDLRRILSSNKKIILGHLEKSKISALSAIDLEIHSLTQSYFKDSYKVKFENSAWWVRKYRWETMQITPQIEADMLAKIRLYTDWRYPALEIGCCDGYWTKHMIAADPFYVTDRFTEFLNNAKSQFPPEYQRRLRPYEMRNGELPDLPKGQFSFVFSWNYFNYLPLGEIKEMLTKVWWLLSPGGTVLFTFNDGDTWRGAENAELNFMTYVPRSMLEPMVKSIGYTITEYKDYTNTVTYLEIKKPGELSTIKMHQTLGVLKEIII